MRKAPGERAGMRAVFAGVDVGSVSVNVAGVDAERNLVGQPVYVRIAAHPSPVDALKAAFTEFLSTLPPGWQIVGSGTTGSGRELTPPPPGCCPKTPLHRFPKPPPPGVEDRGERPPGRGPKPPPPHPARGSHPH